MLFLRSALFNLAFYLWTALLAVLWLPALALPAPAVVRGQRLWARGVLAMLRAICGIVVEVRDGERLPAGPVLIAAKHQSALDTLVWHSALDDPAIVLKRELLAIPLYGWYALKVRMIPVDRAGGARALRGMLAAGRRAVAAARPIVIFPQGTRTAPGLPVERAPYRPGVAALYRGLGVPAVPVAVNSGLHWPRRTFLRYPGRVVYRYLEPIPPGLDRAAFERCLIERIEPATAALEAQSRERS